MLEFRAHQNALLLLHCWTMGVKTAFTRPRLRLGHLDPFGRCLESNDVPGSRPNAPGKPKNYPQLFTRSQMLRWKKETYEGQQPDSKSVDVLADVGRKWLLDMESCETGAYRIEFLDLKPITCAVNQLPSIMLHMNLGKVSFGSGVILVIALSTQLMQWVPAIYLVDNMHDVEPS